MEEMAVLELHRSPAAPALEDNLALPSAVLAPYSTVLKELKNYRTLDLLAHNMALINAYLNVFLIIS